MFFRNRLRRRRRQSAPEVVQALESRALLSATAVLQNRTLTVTGTAGADNTYIQNWGNLTKVTSNGQQIGVFTTSQISSITANMGGGNDSLNIRHWNAQFDRITINMGTGGSEFAHVETNLVKTLTVDSRTTRTDVQVYRTTVNSLQATFGSAGDSLKFYAGSVVNTIDVDLGSGNDTVGLYGSSTIRGGQIKMGDGNDLVVQARTNKISATVFGGNGYDKFTGFAQDQGVRLPSFEEIVWQ
jgi:hypothetical protein